MSQEVYMIAGLGNPGEKYRRTRHNIGFMAADLLVEEPSLSASSFNAHKQWQADISRATFKTPNGDKDLILLKPRVFINLSGECLAPAVKFYKIVPQKLLVIHDEIELPFGKVLLKKGGGHKGHNGLRDIIQKCGSADFHRLRMGVSRPESRAVADYVLAPFSQTEQDALPPMLEECRTFCLDWLASS